MYSATGQPGKMSMIRKTICERNEEISGTKLLLMESQNLFFSVLTVVDLFERNQM